MSAKALAATGLEPAAKQPTATDHQVLEGLAAELQFREALWHEYRLEAVHAGASPDQATEYASALSPEMGLVASLSEKPPARRGWFYQSGVRAVERTVASGLITLARRVKRKSIGRTAATGASVFPLGYRPWNVGGKN